MKKCFYASLLLALVACGNAPKSESDSLAVVAKAEQKGVENDFVVESMTVGNDRFSSVLPMVVAVDPSKFDIAKNINKNILDNFFLSEYAATENFQYNVKFEQKIEDDLLILHFTGDVLGAYLSEIDQTDYYNLSTGEKMDLEASEIPFKNFFASEALFNKFYKENWQADIEKAFAEAKECAEGEVPDCSEDEIFYEVEGSEVVLTSGSDCYPHVLQACSPFLQKKISFDKLHEYLAPEAEALLKNWNNASVKSKLAYKCSWASK